MHIRNTRPLLVADFWGDGTLTGGCLSGGRKYIHINNKGDVEPCIFAHFATDNIKDKPLLDCLCSDFFKDLRRMQPFGKNLLRPCPIIDHPAVMKTGGGAQRRLPHARRRRVAAQRAAARPARVRRRGPRQAQPHLAERDGLGAHLAGGRSRVPAPQEAWRRRRAVGRRGRRRSARSRRLPEPALLYGGNRRGAAPAGAAPLVVSASPAAARRGTPMQRASPDVSPARAPARRHLDRRRPPRPVVAAG